MVVMRAAQEVLGCTQITARVEIHTQEVFFDLDVAGQQIRLWRSGRGWQGAVGADICAVPPEELPRCLTCAEVLRAAKQKFALR